MVDILVGFGVKDLGHTQIRELGPHVPCQWYIVGQIAMYNWVMSIMKVLQTNSHMHLQGWSS